MTNTLTMSNPALVSAKDLESLGIMSRTTVYKMAKAGKLPHYNVGGKGRGIRFNVDEVLAALRRPSS